MGHVQYGLQYHTTSYKYSMGNSSAVRKNGRDVAWRPGVARSAAWRGHYGLRISSLATRYEYQYFDGEKNDDDETDNTSTYFFSFFGQ